MGNALGEENAVVKLVWSRRAIRHLVAIREYIAQDNPNSARAVVSKVVAGVELLSEQPNIGRAGRILGTRELVVPGTRYLVPYRIRGEAIDVLAVFHGRQRWPRKL